MQTFPTVGLDALLTPENCACRVQKSDHAARILEALIDRVLAHVKGRPDLFEETAILVTFNEGGAPSQPSERVT